MNLSPRQFRHPQLLDDLIKLLEEAKVAPDRLRLEVTEAAINLDPDFAVAAFQRMVDLGLGVALDNFGAGLASMNHFARLACRSGKGRSPPDLLPTGLGQAGSDHSNHLRSGTPPAPGAHRLRKVSERTEQLEALREYGCDLLQGHLFFAGCLHAKAQGTLAFLESGRWPGNYFV